MSKPRKPKRQHDLTDEWIPCTDAIVTDILRWIEPTWAPRGAKRGKALPNGKQQVVAEVEISSDFIQLYVIEVFKVMPDGSLLEKEMAVKPEDSIRRRPESILEQGNCERLKWVDEGARQFYLDTRKPD